MQRDAGTDHDLERGEEPGSPRARAPGDDLEGRPDLRPHADRDPSQSLAARADRSARASLRRVLAEILDAVYPPSCPLCASPDEGAGLGCVDHRLAIGLAGPRCARCAASLPPMLPDGERCRSCRTRAPGFAALIALCDYTSDAPVREWLLALKYGHRPDLAATLGLALGAEWSRVHAAQGIDPAPATEDELFVPVPLHPLRRLERGYDQARLLARAAGATAGVRVVDALRRARATEVQGAPGSPSRTANVADAFRPARRASRAVAGRSVSIVDDVVTSGATVAECARVLRALGAARVAVLAVARARGE